MTHHEFSFLQHKSRVAFIAYKQNHSSCIKAASEEIPASIDNYVTGVSERSQRRGSLKDEVHIGEWLKGRHTNDMI
ncbi:MULTISPECIES: hypothetical protein [Enterobacteriaceae]|uniref:hypothetical protein n=1 Tax=Enterobacteriaceae TaxID=543 RepID=UPI000FA3BD94|nr:MULTISPECIES: hypothetical protein [Enterobacteriaceae]UJD92888.1 hypothetical protein FS593_00595 [Lelliottia amnigena]